MVAILKIGKDLYMDVNSLNTLAIVYVGFAVIAVGVALVIFLGNRPTKKG